MGVPLRLPVALVIILTGLSAAAPAITVEPATLAKSLLTGAAIPFNLAAGAAGTTTIGPANTSARSSVTGDTLAPAAFNTTFANNTGASAVRVRLTFSSWSGAITDCAVCNLELRRGTATSTQITIANGIVTQSQGAWVTFDASGGPESSWHIYAVAQRTLLADNVVPVKYSIEIVPTDSLAPSLSLHNMTMEFTV